MRVQFERAGGFAPSAMKLSRTVNSAELSSAEADELKRLVADAITASSARQTPDVTPRPDIFYYRVIIEDQGASRTIVASDSDMPSGLRPLINWLTKRQPSS